MLISYNWLKRHIDFDVSLDTLKIILTDIGLEVEGVHKVEKIKGGLENVVVGEVMGCLPHPNADKLKITKISLGNEQNLLQIVCGAPNVKIGMKVALAQIDSFVLDKSNQPFQIKLSKIREIESFGMLCSESELGLNQNSNGLLEINKKTKLGTKLSEIYPQEFDYQIEIGLTPNRADAMSHYGVARDLYAYLKCHKIETKIKNHTPSAELHQIKNLQPSLYKINIQDAADCKNYVGLFLENIEIKESPEWLRTILKTIGIESKNNVVDITNFVLHDMGQPIHAFDADKIGKTIDVKKAKSVPFLTLDKITRQLNEHVLMISDQEKPIALAGIMGGMESCVTENTKNIFLESAYFDPIVIRKSAKSLGISTDASFRFERGVDPNATKNAIYLAADLLKKYANATINYALIEEKNEEFRDFSFIFRYKKLDQILGQKIHRDKVKEILSLLEIKIVSELNDVLELQVPPYRVDIKREIDVIEEILRIYGFNSIESPEKMQVALVLDVNKQKEQIESITTHSLITLGFHQALNHSLTKANSSQVLGISAKNDISLINPLSGDLSVMRQSLLTGLLENISFNLNRQQKNIKLFEFGNIYYLDSKFEKKEQKKLGIIVCGNKSSENWTTKNVNYSFYALKGIIDHIFSRLNICCKESILSKPYLSEGVSLLDENENELGFLGMVSDEVVKKMSINQEVFYAELNWSKIISNSNSLIKYNEISKFPKVRRDLALLIDKSISYADLKSLALKTEEELLTEVNLFDVYEGKNLPENKKSYALSFFLQHKDRTLKDPEIEGIMSKILDKFKKNLNAELR
jgi:phenylalanyl-tRNA synthetase beta chain